MYSTTGYEETLGAYGSMLKGSTYFDMFGIQVDMV